MKCKTEIGDLLAVGVDVSTRFAEITKKQIDEVSPLALVVLFVWVHALACIIMASGFTWRLRTPTSSYAVGS